MRVVIVGYGVQGRKRRAVAGDEVVAVVDPVAPEATAGRLQDVAFHDFDAAVVCTPDEPKPALLKALLGAGKHVLVEKPLVAEDDAVLEELAEIAASTGAVCVTAYNHRFEPHYVRLRDLIRSGGSTACGCSTATAPPGWSAKVPGATRARACCPTSARTCWIP